MANPDGIFLSKNFSIVKHLIEECLRRGSRDRLRGIQKDPMDIPMGMALLRLFLAETPYIYVIADNHRAYDDFREAVNMPDKKITHLWSSDAARGISGSVIVLHTGARSDVQQKRYEQLMEIVTSSKCVIWHVGDWR